MPNKGSTVEFYDGQNQFKVPFMMYVDFEALLELIQERVSGDSNEPYTSEVSWHIPSGWCVYSKFAYGDVDDPLTLYTGNDCVQKFCDHIKQEAHSLYHMFPEKTLDPLTKSNGNNIRERVSATFVFNHLTPKDPKVRDHGHYRGPSHSLCNLRYRIPSYIQVVFHNLSGYDAHLFIKELGSKSSNIGVITKNTEDYVTYSVDVAVDKYMDK